MKKKLFALMMAGVMLLSLTACGGNKTETPAASGGNEAASTEDFTPIVLRFANQHPGDSTATKSDQKICDAIAEATEGRVTVELYTDSSLGDYTSVFEEVMMGTIDMAHTTAVETYDARMSGSMLPYLGSSFEELAKAYDHDYYLYTTVSEVALGLGFRTFGFYCEGFTGVGTSYAVSDPATPGVKKGAI